MSFNFIKRHRRNKIFFKQVILCNVYLKNKNKVDKKVIIYICYKVYLINNFKTNFFISINILESKQIIINILSRKLKFEFCKRILIFCEIKIQNDV